MKKLRHLFATVLVILMIATAVPYVSAAYPTSGKCGANTYWNYNIETKTLSISGEGYHGYRSEYGFYRRYIEHVIVESGVTEIGNYFFEDFEKLKSVELSDTITTIGYGMFDGCTSLTEIRIPAGVESLGGWLGGPALENIYVDSANKVYSSVDGVLYNYDQTELLECPKAKLSHIMPNSATAVSTYALTGTLLQNITLSDNIEVTIYGDFIYFGDQLLNIYVKPTNTKYTSVDGVLFNATGTTLMRFPVGRTGTYRVPETVNELGISSFEKCSLEEVYIPDTVVSIGSGTFRDSNALSEIRLSNNLTILNDYTFANCDALRRITLPESLETIGYRAFWGCAALQTVELPENLVEIGESAFSSCTALEGVELPKGLETIGSGAFGGCRSLKTITLPAGLTKMGGECFAWCDSLQTVTIEGTIKVYGTQFEGCDNLKQFIVADDNEEYSVKDGVLYRNQGFGKGKLLCVYPNGKGRSFRVPDGVRMILDTAFWWSSIEEIEFPDSLEEIHELAFWGCNNLKKVNLPESVVWVESQAFDNCEQLQSVTVQNRECEWETWDNHPRTIFGENVTLIGWSGSTAEAYAEYYGNPFKNIDTHTDYYAELGEISVVTRNPNGTTITGCTVTIDGTETVMDGHTQYFEIPDGYTGDVVVSKSGYLTSKLPAEYLKKHNFFVMYPESEEKPVIQHFLLRDAKSEGNAFVDLLRSNEYIYDLDNKKHDIYIDVNANGHTITKIYLMQGNKKVALTNGEMVSDINSNGIFNSENGAIFLCIETAEGNLFKIDSNIIATEERLTMDADIGGEISGVIDEELSAVGGMSWTGKCKLGDLPVSITMEEYKVKGTIGIQGSESNTATWYDAIKDTIKTHEDVYGDKEYTAKEMKDLEKRLQDSCADVVEGSSSFGIDVTGSIIGYIEANWNPETARLENVQLGVILKIGGSASYTQQSSFVVVGVPVPYYWTVELGIELAAEIKGIFQEGADHKIDFSIEMPEFSIGAEITGSLCLGMDKIFGGGGKVKGGLTLTFKAPNYDFSTSVVSVSYEVGLTGQIAGFSGDLQLTDGTFQLYPQETAEASLEVPNLMAAYTKSNQLLAAGDSVATSYELDGRLFKSNGYTHSAPTAVALPDGTVLMVWVDYDELRTDINKTALFYSVFDPNTWEWTEPQQVENDGTADDYPVLKVYDDTAYLVWNDSDQVLPEDATFDEMLSSMGVSYAEFWKGSFYYAGSVSGTNDYMDIAPDLAILEDDVAVVWLKNEENDLFGQNGTNALVMATPTTSAWEYSEVLTTESAINSFTVVNEEETPVIYYSADADAELDTLDDYEIFRLSNGVVEQITDNDQAERTVSSCANRPYWRTSQGIGTVDEAIDCGGIGAEYAVAENELGYRTVVYTVERTNGETAIMACVETGSGFCDPVELWSGNFISGGITAVSNEYELMVYSNEVNMEDLSSGIYEIWSDFSPNLNVTDVTHDPYTVMANGQLRLTAEIENVGLGEANGYTVVVYGGETELYSEYISFLLMPGERVERDLLVDLPETVDFSEITVTVSDENEYVHSYNLPISVTDVSAENAMIIADGTVKELTVSVVNRGITTIDSAAVSVHKDTEDGPVLVTSTVEALNSRTEEVLTFDLSEYEESTVYYVTIDGVEGETSLANNSDFAVVSLMTMNEVVVEEITDGYEKILQDESKTVTVNSEQPYADFVFTPEEDGVYDFYSTSESDTIGYILDYDNPNNQVTNDDDGGEGFNFRVRYEMTAGKKYILRAAYLNTSTSGSFDVCVVKALTVTGLEMISPPNRTEYIEGLVEENLNLNGLKLRATWSDGSTTDWEYGDGWNIGNEPLYRDDSTVDVDGIIRFICGGKEALCTLTLAENPVESIEVVSGKVTCIENFGGYINQYYDEESDSWVDYYYYSDYEIPSDVKIQINYTDGTGKTAGLWDEIDGYWFSYESNQGEKPWILGDDNGITVSYLGKTAEIPVSVIKNPVESIEVVSGKVTCIENFGGYTDQYYDEESDSWVDYYYYSDYEIPSDVKVKINYTDGTCKTAGLWDEIDGYWFSYGSKQWEKPWVLGDDNGITVSYLGKTAEIPVSVIENPVESIEVVSGKVTCIENTYGWINERYDEETDSWMAYYHYSDYEIPSAVKMKINYTDGTNEIVGFWDEIDGYSFSYESDQGEKPWVLGDDNSITVSYLGKTAPLPVSVIKNPVERIEITTAPTRVYYYGDYEYGDFYAEDFEYMVRPTDMDGLAFTVYYTDGTSKTFTDEDIDEAGRINGYGYSLDTLPYISAPTTQTVTFNYMGRSDTYTIEVKESPVESITVEKLPELASVNHYYMPDLIGMEFKVTYTDQTTEIIKVTEENIVYDYYPMSGLQLKVKIGDHHILLEGYYPDDDAVLCYYEAHYLGADCSMPELCKTWGPSAEAVTLENLTENGDGMKVTVTYEGGVSETLTLDTVKQYAIDSDLYCYARTESGLLSYRIENEYDGETLASRKVWIFGQYADETSEPDVETLRGDANGSGGVDMSDVITIIKAASGATNENYIAANADYNQSGNVDMADAVALLNGLAG